LLHYFSGMRHLAFVFCALVVFPALANAAPCVARKHGARVIHLCGDRVEAFHHRPKKNYAPAVRPEQSASPAATPAPQWRTLASPDAGRHLMMRRTPGEPIPAPAP